MNQRQVEQTCQWWANVTEERTQAVRTRDGIVHYHFADYPLDGERLAIREPEVEEGAR